ncbi:TIGR01244 family sulfur transferase [Tropicibacter oceani]|uniref:TIGR01244 family sulfur transferase n=1 Tax=Tropicibacter oceani TaxID=3058420 RepID=A0ABY8QGM9_9RHOB|nr:TIGR01244 family sulfur transferase [Tropicibacter oceani]WGW03785.1 TIGR01244 family sulfur transferase [Tropicibacter oceani]
MTPRQITPRYHVTPQITPEDMPAVKAAGFVRVICNRPDAENPPALQAEAMAEAAKAAGLEFEVLPLTHQTMTPENVARQKALIDDAAGPVLAYCASGTRCTVIWALGQVGAQGVDEILTQAAQAGYDLAGLRPTLDALAAQKG